MAQASAYPGTDSAGPAQARTLDPDATVTVDRSAHAGLRALAHDAGRADEMPDEGARAAWAEHGAVMAAGLPPDVHRAVARFRAHGAPDEALLLRGLLPDLPDLGLTPGTLTPSAVSGDARFAALALLGVASLLGEPFSFRSLYGGRIVQHVLPVEEHRVAQTSGDSTDLLWHVEDAHRPDRCHYLALLCLRGAPEAVTQFASARAIRRMVGDRWARVLREPRFAVQPDTAHTNGVHHPSEDTGGEEKVCVLSGPDEDPRIRYDAIYLHPADPGDRDAAYALHLAAEAADATAVGHVLEPGEVLVLDNRRAVHGRTTFTARYDGTDRWLLRAMVCADLAAHRSRRGVRTLP
ncbi:TauD/TfdA family dioxygenase [Streptodolium elevatio]